MLLPPQAPRPQRRPGRFLLSSAIADGLLAALIAPAGSSAATTTFNSTGAEQTYTVPPHATILHVVAVGGTGQTSSSAPGGRDAS
jgi:hypothetical protein